MCEASLKFPQKLDFTNINIFVLTLFNNDQDSRDNVVYENQIGYKQKVMVVTWNLYAIKCMHVKRWKHNPVNLFNHS